MPTRSLRVPIWGLTLEGTKIPAQEWAGICFGFFCQLFYDVVGVVALAAVHADLLDGRGLCIDDEEEGGEHLTLLSIRCDGDAFLPALGGHGYIVGRGDGLTVDDGFENGVEGGELVVLTTIGHVFLASHRHRELRTLHDEQLLAAIGRDADVVGLADGHCTCGDGVVGYGSAVLRAGDGLCCCAER